MGFKCRSSWKSLWDFINKWLVLNIITYPTKIYSGQNGTVIADLWYDNGILNDPNHPELYYHDPTIMHVPDWIIVNYTTTKGGSN